MKRPLARILVAPIVMTLTAALGASYDEQRSAAPTATLTRASSRSTSRVVQPMGGEP